MAGPPDFFRLGHRHPWLYRERRLARNPVPRNPQNSRAVLSEEAGRAPPHELNTNSFSVFKYPRGVRGQTAPGGIPTRRRESLRMRTAGGGAGACPLPLQKSGAEPPRVFLIDDDQATPAAPPRPATTPADLRRRRVSCCSGDMGEGEAKGWSAAVEITQRQRGRKGFTRRIAHLYIASQHRCAAATVKEPVATAGSPERGSLQEPGLAIFHFHAQVLGRGPGRRTQTGMRKTRRTTWLRRPRIGPEPGWWTTAARADGARLPAAEGYRPPGDYGARGERRVAEGSAAALGDRRENGEAPGRQLAREIDIALPHELTAEQQVELVRGFVAEHFVSRGMVADFALHDPSRRAATTEEIFMRTSC